MWRVWRCGAVWRSAGLFRGRAAGRCSSDSRAFQGGGRYACRCARPNATGPWCPAAAPASGAPRSPWSARCSPVSSPPLEPAWQPGPGLGPPARPGAFGGHDRGFAGANDFGSAVCFGLGSERCLAPRPTTCGVMGDLPLPRSHTLGFAAFCVFFAGTRDRVSMKKGPLRGLLMGCSFRRFW